MYGELLEQKHKLQLGPKLMKRMQGVTVSLRSGGSVLTVVGGVLGYYDDVYNNDKTPGQAIAHNGASIAVSTGTGAGIGLAAGWIGLGAAAVVGFTFNAAYNNNILGLQDGLDWTGEKIDEGFDWAVDRYNDSRDWVDDKVDQAKDGMRVVGEGIKSGTKNVTDAAVDFADNVGGAVSGGLDAINPFS